MRRSVTWNARKTLWELGVVIILGLGFLSLSCSGDRDEKEIRQLLERVRANVARKAFGKVLNDVASDYSDNVGYRRDTLEGRLNRLFGSYDELEISMGIPKLEKKGLFATAYLKLKIFGQKDEQRERLFGGVLLAREIQVKLEKRQGRWIIAASEVSKRQSFYS